MLSFSTLIYICLWKQNIQWAIDTSTVRRAPGIQGSLDSWRAITPTPAGAMKIHAADTAVAIATIIFRIISSISSVSIASNISSVISVRIASIALQHDDPTRGRLLPLRTLVTS